MINLFFSKSEYSETADLVSLNAVVTSGSRGRPTYKYAIIKFVSLGNSSPPTFIFHGNKLEGINKNYEKFLENFLRKKLKLQGIPIKFVLKTNVNPFKDKKNQLTKRQYAKRKRVRSH